MEVLESQLAAAVTAIRLIVESLGALIVTAGALAVILAWGKARLRKGPRPGFRGLRLRLSEYLALALEFQLAGDILSTTIAPSWEELGRLAAIAAIRTFLNYFLEREMSELRGHPAEQGTAPGTTQLGR